MDGRGSCSREGGGTLPLRIPQRLLSLNSGFEIERSREAFFVTWNPKGYLRRRDDDSIGGKLRRLGKRLAGR